LDIGLTHRGLAVKIERTNTTASFILFHTWAHCFLFIKSDGPDVKISHFPEPSIFTVDGRDGEWKRADGKNRIKTQTN
jgi:hypothetical protein